MADNYSYLAQGNIGYVPQLHSDFIVEFSMDPVKFPYNKYIHREVVPQQVGYYAVMKNDSQSRVVSADDFKWADGSDAPEMTYTNESVEYKQFNCQRNVATRRYGELLINQGRWDILAQGFRDAASQMATFRAYNIHKAITTGANWGSYQSTNVVDASSIGGAVWTNGTVGSTYVPAIRKSMMAAANIILQGTNGCVGFEDLFVVMNGNQAAAITSSAEFIDWLKQNPAALTIWNNDPQYLQFGLPGNLWGFNLVVDNTVYNSAGPGQTPNFTYTFPDDTAVILSKREALKSPVGSSFSTFTLFSYQDFATYQYYDAENKRYKVQVVDNCDYSDNGFVAPQSGVLIATNA